MTLMFLMIGTVFFLILAAISIYLDKCDEKARQSMHAHSMKAYPLMRAKK